MIRAGDLEVVGLSAKDDPRVFQGCSSMVFSCPVAPDRTRTGGEAMDHRSDEDLVAAARGGDELAYRVLFRRHAEVARREARRRCRHGVDVDDIVVAAFSSVFRLVSRGGTSIRHFRAYLLTAVRNAVIDHARRGCHDTVSIEGLEVAVSDARESLDHEPSDQDLGCPMWAAFSSLPARQRDVLWQSEVVGVSGSEIARRMQLRPNAVAALKVRARRNLIDEYARRHSGVGRPTSVAGGDLAA
jgi:RNA polymerase sigma factor (sigma-70 family)